MICFLLMTFSKGLTLINFYLNQETITAKFCVNKNKPQLHCNGKCFLAKKIKEQEQKEAADAIMELSKIEVVSASSYFTMLPEIFFTVVKKNYAVYTENILNTSASRLLKPPRA
jgi:hypothetical protein